MSNVSLEKMVERIRDQRMGHGRGYPMQPPCSEAEVGELQKRIGMEFNITLPERYLDLLRITNGIDENGLRVFSSKTSRDAASDILGKEFLVLGIMEMNREYRDNRDNYDELLVFAETEAYIYAQIINTGEFIKLLHSENEASEIYTTFDEMMIPAMQGILIDPG